MNTTKMNLLKYLIIVGLSLFTHLSLSKAIAQPASKGKVLIVLTTVKTLNLQNGKTYNSAGYYLDELTYPLQKIADNGYQPVFATINGEIPKHDPFSENKMFFDNNDAEAVNALAIIKKYDRELQHPSKLSDAAAHSSDYVGILVPGGLGPMQDLVVDDHLGKILADFHAAKKPVGMICHGPVTLIATLPDARGFIAAMSKGDYEQAARLSENWIYKGYRLTVFSSGEELQLKQLPGKVPYYVSHALSQAGAHVDYVGQGLSNVIEDRELVTGQQPFSAVEFSKVFLAKLDAFTKK